jgi:hypothetical protein
MRGAAIMLHATAAVVALLLGVRLLSQAARHHPPTGFPWYYAGVLAMAAALPVAVALDWPDLDAPTRVAFAALCVLAGTMVWEADRARRFLGRSPAAMSPVRTGAFVEAVGFTVIALLDGFAVITALDLGAPGWVVAVVGVLVILVARPAVVATRARAASRIR